MKYGCLSTILERESWELGGIIRINFVFFLKFVLCSLFTNQLNNNAMSHLLLYISCNHN